ncbi:hypothetical protein NL676_016146 [Syzygium grande]|nr:hypothetical protein NL676_016146 [Syzygium grande]
MANSDAGTGSSNARGGQYQVFLNFHGRDTRDGFTDFLYQDLVENGIHVFMDDEELPVGEEIGGELLRAIDDSQIYIPIFSRNYASSKWCLRELARMVDNTSKSEEKKILPIFYDVVPDDVDLKTPLYRKAIEKHKKEHKKEQEEKSAHEVESWEKALKKVDEIKGWELQKCQRKAQLMRLWISAEVLDSVRTKESKKKSLSLHECPLQSLSIPSSLTQLTVYDIPNLIEIQFLGMSASLEDLYIGDCRSIERIVFYGEVGSVGVLDQSESSLSESSAYFAPGVLLLPNALKKLKALQVRRCKNLLEIQVIGLSNLKNLHYLDIYGCSKLRAVEGLKELEFLTRLIVDDCPSLETSLDISNLKVPDNCRTEFSGC